MVQTPDPADCPSMAEIEAFVSGESADQRLTAHVAGCDTCREQVDAVRANNALMSRLLDSQAGLAPAGAAVLEPGGKGPSIPGYEIVAEMHRGGQGVVYQARQVATHRLVALKVLLAGAFATSKQRRRFEREIELVAGLRHTSIVTVYDSGATGDGGHWFAMEYLEGETLDAYVGGDARRNLPLADRLKLFSQICGAVSYAHQRGIIHRDLKPANVIVDAEGQPHVLDFGLARPINPEVSGEQATVTDTGAFLGTLAYASPEQTTGDPGLVDVRSDVYALGVILYEVLTGRFPYPVTGQMSDIIDAIVHTPPRPLRPPESNPYRLDDEVETIVRKTLAKEPDRRYQSAEALRRDVEQYLAGEPIDAKRDSGWYVLRKTLQRYKLQAGAAAGLVVLLAGFSIAMSLLYQRARTEAEKVTTIKVFLEDTLGSVESPGASEVTVRNFLDEGVYWIEVALADRPEIEAAVRTIIGNAYRNVGQFEAAQRQLLAALETRRAMYGEGHLQLANSYSSLGLLRLTEGRYDEAETHFREAFDIRRRALGQDHLQVAMALNNLAGLMRARGRVEDAEGLYRRSLAIRTARLGEEHADVAMCQFRLAQVAADKGEHARALLLHEQALATRRAVLHAEHPDLARSLEAIGVLHMSLQEPQLAETPLHECLERHRRALPAGHWRTARAHRQYGDCLVAQARYAEGEQHLVTGYENLQTALGPDHVETQSALESLRALYDAWGRPEQAANRPARKES